MAPEKAPAFQFYPKDFLTDSNVVAMNLPERGAYITLLCLCWLDRTLPTDQDALARLCLVSPSKFGKIWPALEPCFTVVNGRLIQGRIERERAKQDQYRAMKVEAGKQGGRPKSTSKAREKQKLSRSKPNESPPSSSSSSSSSPISDLQSPISGSGAGSEQPGTSTIPRARKNGAPGADARFDRFWAVYPNKTGKDDARRAWKKRNPSEELATTITAAVEQQKHWSRWIDGYVPNPATWLNRGSWDDEPSTNGSAVSATTRGNLAARDRVLERMKGQA